MLPVLFYHPPSYLCFLHDLFSLFIYLSLIELIFSRVSSDWREGGGSSFGSYFVRRDNKEIEGETEEEGEEAARGSSPAFIYSTNN